MNKTLSIYNPLIFLHSIADEKRCWK